MGFHPIRAIEEKRLLSASVKSSLMNNLYSYIRNLTGQIFTFEGSYYIPSINEKKTAVPLPFVVTQTQNQHDLRLLNGVLKGQLHQYKKPLRSALIPGSEVHTSSLEGMLIEGQSIQISFTDYDGKYRRFDGNLAIGAYNNGHVIPVGKSGYFFIEVKQIDRVDDFKSNEWVQSGGQTPVYQSQLK